MEVWGDLIYKELFKYNDLVLNLASKEYTKTIRPFLKDSDKFLTIDFKEVRDGKLKSIVSYMKQARGAMLKEIITKKIDDVEEIKKLDINGYTYDPYNSTPDTITFVRQGEK